MYPRNRDFSEQLSEIRPHVGRPSSDHRQHDAVHTNLEEGTATITTPSATAKVTLTETDQREFIENSKNLQKAAIHERRVSAWAHTAILVLTVVTAAGAGFAAYKSTGGSTGNGK